MYISNVESYLDSKNVFSLRFGSVWFGFSQFGWVRLNAFTNGYFTARLAALDAERDSLDASGIQVCLSLVACRIPVSDSNLFSNKQPNELMGSTSHRLF